jgi:hypothetical protein
MAKLRPGIHNPCRLALHTTATLAPSKGRLIRWTVPYVIPTSKNARFH